MLSKKEISEVHTKYMNLVEKLPDEVYAPIKNYLSADGMSELLMSTPASAKKEFHNAFEGGFLDHSVRVVKYARRYLKMAPEIFQNVNPDRITFLCLIHDLGKIGTEEPRYILNTSEWHLKNGNLYSINNKSLTVAHGTLYHMSQAKMLLEDSDIIAILSSEGYQTQDVSRYENISPPISNLLRMSKDLAIQEEKLTEN